MSKSSLKPETGDPRKSGLARPTPTAPTGRRHKRKVAPFETPTRRWPTRLGIIVAFTAIGGLTFTLFAMGGLQLALRFREVRVPDLAGRTVNEADVILEDAGLRLRLEPLSQIHQTVPANHIATQDPAPGLATRSQRSVKVWLSSGPSAGSVPTLLGQSETGARARLQEDALALGGLSEIQSNRYPSDAVIGQEPPPQGASATVSVLLNRGERGATYVMPDLIGVYGSKAAEVLRAAGFRVTVVGDHPYPGVAPDIVLRQFPQAGFQIAHGEAISLEVSQ